MDTKHTPGPWIAQPGDNFITDDRDIVICEMHRHHADDQVNANARLISAAPELLEALQLCEGNISSLLASNHPRVYGEWLNVVRAAVAKATGE